MVRIMIESDKDYFVTSVTNTVNFGAYEEAKVFYSVEEAQEYYKSFPDEFIGARFDYKIVFCADLF